MILCIGEILVDMIGKKHNDKVVYERFAGGAPFNVACNIKKQNGEVGFIGSVGDDLIGDFLVSFSEKQNFDCLSLKKLNDRNTTLAFVELDEKGERAFSFYRKNTADYCIEARSVNDLIDKAKIVHIGSLMLSEKSGRRFADKIFNLAKKKGKLVSFDVNFRDDIYSSRTEAVKVYKKYICAADILKFSEDEVAMFSKFDDLRDILRAEQLAFVTLGARGSKCIYKGREYAKDSIRVQVKDTTGAGDAFYAGVLSQLDRYNNLDEAIANIEYILKYSNICGALTTTNFGAIDASPTQNDVLKFI